MSPEPSLVSLIEDALAEFGHYECPHCQRYIGLDRYVDKGDIKRWLKRQNYNVAVVDRKACPPRFYKPIVGRDGKMIGFERITKTDMRGWVKEIVDG
jgi:hypothetical protein